MHSIASLVRFESGTAKTRFRYKLRIREKFRAGKQREHCRPEVIEEPREIRIAVRTVEADEEAATHPFAYEGHTSAARQVRGESRKTALVLILRGPVEVMARSPSHQR